jgi:ribose-phosphate pyrophosphokinase
MFKVGRLDYINPSANSIREEHRWHNLIDGQVKYSIIKFPGGETNVSIDTGSFAYHTVKLNCYSSCWSSAEDIINVLLLKDALHRCGVTYVDLYIPYLPFARQDRVCNHGESLSLKVIAGIINSAKFRSVVALDPHSDVVTALIDNCQALSAKLPISQMLSDLRFKDREYGYPVLVVPDAGAYKKVSSWSEEFLQNFSDVMVFNKTRELMTGEITGMSIIKDANIEGKNVVVVDDICDGGRTFIEIASMLKGRKPISVSLYTTHGIYSQGLSKLSEAYDNIYCTSSVLSRHIDISNYRLHVMPCDFTIQPMPIIYQ